MDPELLKARRFIREKIFHFLVQRQSQTQAKEISQRRIVDIVKRLEEGLFRTAVSQEEYLNLDTLESRLYVFIRKQLSLSRSAPVGTMSPTPGMSQHGNSNLIASATDISAVSSGSGAYLLPTETGSSSGMHGVSTPTSDVGGSVANGKWSFMNMESASNSSAVSNNDSSLPAQRLPQKQPIGNQNSSAMESMGNQMGGNGGFGSYIHPLNGSGSSENYLTATEIGGSGSPKYKPSV